MKEITINMIEPTKRRLFRIAQMKAYAETKINKIFFIRDLSIGKHFTTNKYKGLTFWFNDAKQSTHIVY